ncbi:hypothetical protein ES703_22083 [subsurface metagenome]|nr:hypothetical protein [Dehalococcoidia bacterium]
MADWQITAATIYCDDVDDEVTVIVQGDGAVRCVGFGKYSEPGKDAAGLIKGKSRRLKRQLKCTGPECNRITDYRDRLFAEEEKQVESAGSSQENGPEKQRK